MITAYLCERFRPKVFVPLAMVIAAAAAAGSVELARLGFEAAFALLLLAEFRLWDDLADRRADRATHPDRVLVRRASVRRFIALVMALALVNVTIAFVRDGLALSLWTILALHVALALWYARRSGRTLAGDQLLLAKYPAFVVIVAGARTVTDPLTIGLAAGVLYAAVSVYEAWHDPSSPVGLLIGGRS